MGSGALSLKIPSMCIGADGAFAAALKRRLAISACHAPILRAMMGLTAFKVLGRVGLTALKVAPLSDDFAPRLTVTPTGGWLNYASKALGVLWFRERVGL